MFLLTGSLNAMKEIPIEQQVNTIKVIIDALKKNIDKLNELVFKVNTKIVKLDEDVKTIDFFQIKHIDERQYED